MTKWYNWTNEVLSSVGIALGIDISTSKDVLGLVLVILNILVLLISLALKLVTWFKKAKEDGKITKEEIDEAIDIVNDSIKEIEKTKGEDENNAK